MTKAAGFMFVCCSLGMQIMNEKINEGREYCITLKDTETDVTH